MKKLICPECKTESLIEKKGDYETLYVDRDSKSHPLTVPGVTWLECQSCGEVILGDPAMSAIETARRKALRLLTPEDLYTFRVRLGKTQKAMSDLLGIGRKSYCRWESGSYIQSEAFDRYLRLLMAAETNVVILQDIASGKSNQKPEESPDDLRQTFSSIKDIDVVAESSHKFVALFSRGMLQVA